MVQVADLRGQHGELSAEADSTREKLSRQLQEKQEEIQQVLLSFVRCDTYSFLD